MIRRLWSRDVLLSGPALLGYLAGVKLLLHFYFNSYYAYQRDELYFIACGEHLAWGYVDVGPLAMWLGRLSREELEGVAVRAPVVRGRPDLDVASVVQEISFVFGSGEGPLI